MSTLIPPERTKVTIDDDNHVEPVDGDGVEWAAVFKVTAFHPLTIELPDVGATVGGPVKVELPRIRVTVKRLLSEVFDPRGLAPVIVGDMPGPGYQFEANDGTKVTDILAWIHACAEDFEKVHTLYQEYFDKHGALLEPVL